MKKGKWFYPAQRKVSEKFLEQYANHLCVLQVVVRDMVIEQYNCFFKEDGSRAMETMETIMVVITKQGRGRASVIVSRLDYKYGWSVEEE